MKEIIIIGAGGHAAELYEYIRVINKINPTFNIKGLIDDDKNNHNHYAYNHDYLGEIKNHEIREDVYYLMGIANLKFRKEIVTNFLEKGAKFTGLIHPTAIIASTAIIDETVIISHNASVGPMAKIGAFSMLNSRCTIGHDSVIGEYNFISPQVAISGNTKIGNGNLLGTNSATIPGVKIGNNNKIGAGAIVIFDVPSDVTVVGNKARILEK